VVDFLSVIIEFFSLGVTAEAPEQISIENRLFEGTGPVWPKISGRRGRPPSTFLLVRKL